MTAFAAFLNNRLVEPGPLERLIAAEEARADLETLREIIRTRHSYVAAVGYPYERAIDAMAERLPERVSVRNLTLQVQKLVQHLGDSHAQVVDWMQVLPDGYSPVAIGIEHNLAFAYDPDTRRLLDGEHPFVRSIDGLPFFQWLERAGDITSGPYASRSQRLARSLRLLRHVSYMRRELGLPAEPNIAFELCDASNHSVRTVMVPVAAAQMAPGPLLPLPTESGIRPGNIGYLRIHSQNDSALAARIDQLMAPLRDTDALIIDARQCGGGTRECLSALFPYFMTPEDGPYIHNVARLRAPAQTPLQTLIDLLKVDDKAMSYRADPGLPAADRMALEALLAGFEPQWQVPDDDFTDWYFGVLPAVAGKPHYDRPVYVLMDWGVGSAGDIFVSTFKGWRNVTLVGSASNGRSGNSIPFLLPQSRIRVRLSTMASFQKSGEMYDGFGIAPDIAMEARMSDWLGKTDTILDRVMAMARRDRPKAA
ncbi:S41 family peptidase [Bosea sp. 2KB_26]|uniref:S41 family peptidase n=1 Tax=Bosea sp. 2KB_26 TaxID=3237475 RepID=UPI003F915BE3